MKIKKRKTLLFFSIVTLIIVAYHWPYVEFHIIDKTFVQIPLTEDEIQQFNYYLDKNEYRDLKINHEEYVCIAYRYSLKGTLKKNKIKIESYKIKALKKLKGKQISREITPVVLHMNEEDSLVGTILIKKKNLDSKELIDVVEKSDLQISYSYLTDNDLWIRLGSKSFKM
ncbi:hypothetical protein [Aminipila sp.]|uniref:hypothetical protein n=1 Tax=Aminipila sp. TaxID=2060095 RepID=UPI00289E2486|nr:hypothetical protein [Aminipila sp.]